MTLRIDDALEPLAEREGLSPEHVARTGLVRDRLILETERDGHSRWFAFDGALTELDPWSDDALPICAAGRLDPERHRILGYRPGRRIALREEREDGPRFVKGLRRKRLADALHSLERVHAAIRSDVGFVVPRVVSCSKSEAAFETEWLDLRPLRVQTSSAHRFEHVGLALRALQAELDSRDLPAHGWAEEIAVLDGHARTAERTLGSVPSGWARARSLLPAWIRPCASPVAVHRDLHDGQLLSGGGRIGLLDFDLLSRGSVCLDLANLTVHLELRQLQNPEATSGGAADACGRALLVGYDVGSGFELHRELRAYQGASFLRLALLYAQRPRWAHLVPDLIRYSERCLDEYQMA